VKGLHGNVEQAISGRSNLKFGASSCANLMEGRPKLTSNL
jgi:hypothetical protein